MDLFKVLLTGVLLTSPMLYAETVKIYAAASLTNAITDISRLYEQQHQDIQIVPVFAASSVLAKQIAPTLIIVVLILIRMFFKTNDIY